MSNTCHIPYFKGYGYVPEFLFLFIVNMICSSIGRYARTKMNSLLEMLAQYGHSASHCHITSVRRLGEIGGAATARDAGDFGVC